MMHGPEKSDPAIVVTKPVNKAGRPAAEPMERRAGTKGNAGQQSTCRTQSRASVSQELERIRKVARERKKERLTALFHHISVDLLKEAFSELKEDAAPGVDQLEWRDYETDLERNLEDLPDRVHRGVYCGPVLGHPAELLPAVGLGGRVWLGGRSCKGGPAAPAFGG